MHYFVNVYDLLAVSKLTRHQTFFSVQAMMKHKRKNPFDTETHSVFCCAKHSFSFVVDQQCILQHTDGYRKVRVRIVLQAEKGR